MASSDTLLQGAYDLHVHASPDVVPRRQDLLDLARSAREAGMGGIALKDHTSCTAGRVYLLNRLFEGSPAFYGCIALNPPVGGLNPTAAESALREGARIIHFPTYGARNHIRNWGLGKPPTAFPVPHGFTGDTVHDETGAIRPVVDEILDLIIHFDAVLTTGHIAPEEALSLVRRAAEKGVRKIIVNHVLESVAAMTPAQQRELARLGALVEQSFFALTSACPNSSTVEEMRDQIRAVGPQSIILSSDLGQMSNMPPVEGFAYYLHRLEEAGIGRDDLRVMIRDNPLRLIG